jgi:hypothetical protein
LDASDCLNWKGFALKRFAKFAALATLSTLLLALLALPAPLSAQQAEQQPASPPATAAAQSATPQAAQQSAPQVSAAQQATSPQAAQNQSGIISGTIQDPTGAPIAGAKVSVARADALPKIEVLTDEAGGFYLVNVPPGPFQLTISANGFQSQTIAGTLQAGDVQQVPKVALSVATVVTELRVSPPTFEIAEEEIKEQEKQRVLGVVPNFYVTYDPTAAPLSPRQKFELAWKSTLDPMTFGLVGAIAGFQQATNEFNGYGQGAQGFGKRYGATYADVAVGTMIGSYMLPSLLKQDPRYFYKGTGTKRSRLLYAMANAVICKGDNGHWQPNYSAILGSLAAGGISNLYYPEQNRDGLELTFENALIGIGENAGANILQEFVIRKLTPRANQEASTSP